jgi:hypothetical protein
MFLIKPLDTVKSQNLIAAIETNRKKAISKGTFHDN